MKKKTKIITIISVLIAIIILAAAIFWFSMPGEQRNMLVFMMRSGASYDNYQEYQVVDRNESAPVPSSFEPVTAEGPDDYNVSITVIAGRMLNEDSNMFKKATVRPDGSADYTGWQLIADEGFEDGVNTFGPSPLSYLTTGAAANLHTQVLRTAEILDAPLGDVKVEVLNKFHWEEMLSDEGAGFLGESHTNIIIESSESEDTIRKLTEVALNSWTAGEAFGNETSIVPTLIINGEHWEKYRTVPGTSLSDESYVEGLRISHITDGPKKSEYFEQVNEEDNDVSFNAISNLVFEILAVSESANNPERPYLEKITVSFNRPSSETRKLYADELSGTGGTPLAPPSLEYLPACTALCLTSQLTLVSAMMYLDFSDFRVEQQIDYREEAVNTAGMAGCYIECRRGTLSRYSSFIPDNLISIVSRAFSLSRGRIQLKGTEFMA